MQSAGVGVARLPITAEAATDPVLAILFTRILAPIPCKFSIKDLIT
jgi:hypothetical protein